MNKGEKPYKKHIEWRFKAGRYEWAIVSISKDRKNIFIEETQKNGQEDLHMNDNFFLGDNGWVVEKE